ETGLLDARGRTKRTGLRACGKVPRHCGSLKTCPGMKKHQDHSVRRLPGPASSPLCEGDQTPEAHHELFRDWQRTQTQSSATALRSPRQQMDVWFCGEQEPPAERLTCATANPDWIDSALSQARHEHLCFSVDFDLH